MRSRYEVFYGEEEEEEGEKEKQRRRASTWFRQGRRLSAWG